MITIPVNDEVFLHNLRSEHAPALFRAVDKNRAHLRPWLNWVDGTISPDDSLQFIEDAIIQQCAQEAINLAIFRGKEIIGGIGLQSWNHQIKKGHIGYWISKEEEGKGLMHLCLTHFISFLFNRLALNKVEIHFVPSNSKSAKLANRLGAKVEGVLRQSYLRHGQLEDLVITGILRQEWQAPTSPRPATLR